MRLTELTLTNFRTLDKVHVAFPTCYSAICGRNNAGKTNLVKAVRAVLRERHPFRSNEPLSFKEDYPVWKSRKDGGPVSIRLTVSVHKKMDEGIYKFIEKFAGLPAETPEVIEVSLMLSATEEKTTENIEIHGTKLGDFEMKEIFNKFRASKTIVFHNSPGPDEDDLFYYRRGHGGVLGDVSPSDRDAFEALQKRINGVISKIAKKHQKDVAELLGKLEDKYEVGLTAPKLNLDHIPFDMSLGYKGNPVPLEEWGSGTRNRTQILLALLRAKRIAESAEISDKITPVIVVEEPESFLHPSAQAQFGLLLRDLAEELGIQVITTTHSPYMLSTTKPEANVLLDRRREKSTARETVVVDTSGGDWMKPFALALGTGADEFKPWQQLFFGGGDTVLLVEGETDKEYFEMLRDGSHADKGLRFTGDIFPYNGKDSLKNQILLRYLRGRCKKLFITYDLDCDQEMQKVLTAVGLKKGTDYIGIGVEAPGKKDVEGLLPDVVRSTVYGKNADLIDELKSGDSSVRNTARGKLKKLLLAEFRAVATPGQDFVKFYEVCKVLNRAFV